MSRFDEDAIGRAEFDLLTGVGNGDRVAEVAGETDVVRDEDHGDARILFEILEQVHDLGLDADIERGCRLVEDEQLGIHDEGGGDDDALALAAAELVGVALADATREPDAFQ